MPLHHDDNDILNLTFGVGDILIQPVKIIPDRNLPPDLGTFGVTLLLMDKRLPINVPGRTLPEGFVDIDHCNCGSKPLVRLLGMKPGDLDALIAALMDVHTEMGAGAVYTSTVQFLRARLAEVEGRNAALREDRDKLIRDWQVELDRATRAEARLAEVEGERAEERRKHLELARLADDASDLMMKWQLNCQKAEARVEKLERVREAAQKCVSGSLLYRIHNGPQLVAALAECEEGK